MTVDLKQRREEHWRSSITKACNDVLMVVDPDRAFQPTYPQLLAATIAALMAELDHVKSESDREPGFMRRRIDAARKDDQT